MQLFLQTKVILFIIIFTLDQATVNCNESTGIDRFLSDKYSKIHFSNNGLLFFTAGAGSGLVSVAGSLTTLELSVVEVVGLLSSGFAGPSMVEMDQLVQPRFRCWRL